MGKRDRYSIKQKTSVVRSVLSGKESITGAARELGCMRSAIKRWLEQYRQYGAAGFSLKQGRYEVRFKLQVVDYYLKKGLSLIQTASYFKIPNEGVISQWVKSYKRSGVAGLSEKPRGRKKTIMAKKPPKKQEAPVDPMVQKMAEMEKELEYLRAENAFLKKLDALIQQEEAEKRQARRPKPSRN
jgi:transposase